MYHSGIGPTHVESFFSTLGVPSVGEKTLKRREREVFPHISKVAQLSCDSALQEEIQITNKKSSWYVS